MYIWAVACCHLRSSREVRSVSSTCISLVSPCLYFWYLNICTHTFFRRFPHYFSEVLAPRRADLFALSDPSLSTYLFTAMRTAVLATIVYSHCERCTAPQAPAFLFNKGWWLSVSLIFKDMNWSPFLKICTFFFWGFGPTASGLPACS